MRVFWGVEQVQHATHSLCQKQNAFTCLNTFIKTQFFQILTVDENTKRVYHVLDFVRTLGIPVQFYIMNCYIMSQLEHVAYVTSTTTRLLMI